MKKLFTLTTAILLSAALANAQYLFPKIGNGNPGGLNTDPEYPEGGGQATGWTAISGASNTTPTWSNLVTLPFSFDFAGQSQTQFKVSTSGVLTFSTGSSTVPGATAATLPSASIPDNSISIWGISGRGTNDKIFTKVFGSAPNRQLWIQFNSYSLPSPANSQCYTYYSIVLEETTNKFYIVDSRNNGCTHNTTIGWQMDGSTAFALAGSPNIGSSAGADPSDIDNVYYEFEPGLAVANDIGVLSLDVPKFVANNSSATIKATIINQGTSIVNDITLKYQSNNGTIESMSITNAALAANGGRTEITHSTPLQVNSLSTKNLKVWVESTGNQNVNNDTAYAQIGVLSFIPTKRIVFEEATGTWCGWCPRGTVFMDSLHKTYPTTAMLIAVHNSDPMVVAEYDAGIAGYIGGYPSGLVDRKNGEFDPSEFFTEYSKRINEVAACDIDVQANYNAGTRVMDITMSATFASDATGDYRFNCVIVEDDVTGTASGYAQVNYYSGGAQGPMGNYHNLPSPVPASQMVYDHVARAILGGWAGTESSIPASVTANSVHTYNYQYTVPANVDPGYLHVIGWVTDANTGEILNANEMNFATGVATQKAETFTVSTFPNPSNGVTNFEVKMPHLSNDISLEIFDITGRLVYSTNEGGVVGGSKFFTWNADASVANGVYQAIVKVGTESVAAKVVLAR